MERKYTPAFHALPQTLWIPVPQDQKKQCKCLFLFCCLDWTYRHTIKDEPKEMWVFTAFQASIAILVSEREFNIVQLINSKNASCFLWYETEDNHSNVTVDCLKTLWQVHLPKSCRFQSLHTNICVWKKTLVALNLILQFSLFPFFCFPIDRLDYRLSSDDLYLSHTDLYRV